jgi:hypothetical protein
MRGIRGLELRQRRREIAVVVQRHALLEVALGLVEGGDGRRRGRGVGARPAGQSRRRRKDEERPRHVLYNIGLTQKALFRYGESIATLERYLKEAGGLPPERQRSRVN